MNETKNLGSMDRREFAKLSAIASTSILFPAAIQKAETAPKEPTLIHRNERSSMTYRKLGRTNFMSSRLVFGCGAALAGGKGVRLLDRAFEVGINHYDIGSDIYYKQSERTLAPFMKAHRDEIWVASKAPLASLRVKPDESITLEQAKTAAKFWTKLLNASLKDLQTDYVDAYYLMAVNNPAVIQSEEIYQAFLDAKSAGKVGHFGISTHKNAAKTLEAAIETGWYDLAMIGVTPSGWYDWDTKSLEEGTPVLSKLQNILNKSRDAGIGLIGMKTVRYLAPMSSAGKGDPTAFDEVYDKKFKETPLSPFQRAYIYALEHGLDVVNADMQNFKHLEENITAAATSQTYFG